MTENNSFIDVPIGANASDVDMANGSNVQESINQLNTNKLNKSDVTSYVHSEVTDWLNDNVTPAGSAVVVDQSLSIQGAAADAKKTGDQISGLKEDLTLLEDEKAPGIFVTSDAAASHDNLGTTKHTIDVLPFDAVNYGNAMYANDINFVDYAPSSSSYNGVTCTRLSNGAFLFNGTLNSGSSALTDYLEFASDEPFLTEGEILLAKIFTSHAIRLMLRDGSSELTDRTISTTNTLFNVVLYKGISAAGTQKIRFRFIWPTAGDTLNNVIIWFGMYHQGTVFTDLGESPATSFKTRLPKISTLYYPSEVTYLADTKEYVDALDVDINDKLSYITPEKFYGGKIPSNVDASQYIAEAITYGTTNNVAVFCGGSYTTSQPIDVECNNTSIFINKLNYTGQTGYALRICGRRNLIDIVSLSSSAHGFALYTKSSSKTATANSVMIARIFCTGNCISLIKADDATGIVGGYTSYNTIRNNKGQSQTGNIIYVQAGSGANENHIYGHDVATTSDYVIKDEYGGNYYYDFCLESAAYSGIYLSGSGCVFTNLRTTELLNMVGKDKGVNRKFLKITNYAANVKFINSAVFPNAIDMTEHSIPPYNIGNNDTGYLYGLYMRSPVVRCDYFINGKSDYYMNSQLYYAMAGGWALDWNGRAIHKPIKALKIDVSSDKDMNVSTEATYFNITSNCQITLSPSYCPDGISEIYIKQTNGNKATVYNDSGTAIFNGTSLADGLYKISFVSELFAFNPTTTVTLNTIIFGALGIPIVERVDVVA